MADAPPREAATGSDSSLAKEWVWQNGEFLFK